MIPMKEVGCDFLEFHCESEESGNRSRVTVEKIAEVLEVDKVHHHVH